MMHKSAKEWLMIAASLMLAGGIIFGGVMAMLQWDFTKLSTIKYETNDYELNEAYKNISIAAKNADILFVPSENSKTSVVCHEQKNRKHLVAVKDGALVIEAVDTGKWYEHIGINFGTPKITVYLPQGEFGALLVQSSTGDVVIPKDFKFESIDISESTGNITNYASASDVIKIKTSTGNIRVENISAGTLDLSTSTGGIAVSNVTCEGDVKSNVSTGRTSLTDLACKSVISSGSAGNISLKNVIAAEDLSIKRSTGNVSFEDSDAAQISVKTSTGDVTGTLLSEKVFITETSTGRISVPKTTSGGKCEIKTSTGDIKIDAAH